MNRETDDLRSSTGARAPHGSSCRARRGGWRRDIRLLLLLAAAWVAPAMAQVPPAFPGCDTRAFLFQGAPTNVIAIDLVTGASTPVGTNIAPPNLNGVAYNLLDNYIYGVSNTPGATLGRVYRIGSDFSVQDLGLPTGLPAAGYDIGEFDGNSAVLQPGGTVVYTITVRNVGTADASDVVVSDPIPLGIDAYAWTCAATGLTCPNASGSGAVAEQIASFPVGASAVYTVTATLSADPPATVNNTATVTPGGIATCADGSAPPCPATAIGTVVPPHTPLPVPTVHLWAQLLIALSLFGLAWRKRRS